MRAVVHHAKFLFDHCGDALAGPHVAQKAISLGAIAQESRQLGHLLGGQAGAEPGGMRWAKAWAPPVRARFSH